MANESKKDFNAMLKDSKDMPKYVKITDEASIKKYGGDNMYFAPPIYFITYTTIETLFRIIKRMIKVIILNNKYGKIIGN